MPKTATRTPRIRKPSADLPAELPRYMTRAQAAALLQTATTTFDRMLATDQSLAALRIRVTARHVLFRTADLEAWIEARHADTQCGAQK